MKSPTQRTLELLIAEGWLPWVVERRLPGPVHRTVDLYNFADVVAIHERHTGVLAVQTTTANNMAARVKKVRAAPAARLWLATGNAIEVHGWRKKGRFWLANVRGVALADLEG